MKGFSKATVTVVNAPIMTYKWDEPSRYPIFLPGWRGSLYPYTMEDRLLHKGEDRDYTQVILENEYIQVIVLPELGGHLWRAYDKVCGEEIFYNNHVVKAALIAMRGAWWASGIEWNFPRGHTVSTVSPVDYRVLENDDGSVSVAVGDIDRISRMKWTVKITVTPGRTGFSIDSVLSNPTAYPHRYMYWANCAMHANDRFQFISPAKSAWTWGGPTKFPIVDGVDKSWIKEHPRAIDYFTLGRGQDYFGYFDHGRRFGAVHVADCRIMPGKKFFTWGTAQHGDVWSNNLTDDDGPYIELQCGLTYTQAEYRFFPPQGSIRWHETWYPVADLGYFVYANEDAALHLSDLLERRPHAETVEVALVTRERVAGVSLEVTAAGRGVLKLEGLRLAAGRARRWKVKVDPNAGEMRVRVRVKGRTLLEYSTDSWRRIKDVDITHVVSEPKITERSGAARLVESAVFKIKNLDYGAALELVERAVKKNPRYSDARYWKGNILFAEFLYDRARRELKKVSARSKHYEAALALLGEIARFKGRWADAERAAAVLEARPGGRVAGAVLRGKVALAGGRYGEAAGRLSKVARMRSAAPEAICLHALALRLSGRKKPAVEAAKRALAVDCLNHMAENELKRLGEPSMRDEIMRGSEENYLELASHYEDLLLFAEAAEVLEDYRTHVAGEACGALVYYHLARCNDALGRTTEAGAFYERAAAANPDGVFAFRREDILALEAALAADAEDAHALYQLGNVCAWRFRYDEALDYWKKAAGRGLKDYPVLLRNIARINLRVRGDSATARRYYSAAIKAAPRHEELYAEADEAFGRLKNVARRIDVLEQGARMLPNSQKIHKLLARCYFNAGRYDDAIACLMGRSFDRWEGDRTAHAVYQNSWMQKGKGLLRQGRHKEALSAFGKAVEYPENFKLGRPAYPRLAPQHYLTGIAFELLGRDKEARAAWLRGAAEEHYGWDGSICPQSYYKGLCLARLGKADQARRLWRRLRKGLSFRFASDAANNYVKGLGHQGLEEWGSAVEHFEAALADDRTNRDVIYHLKLAKRRKQASDFVR